MSSCAVLNGVKSVVIGGGALLAAGAFAAAEYMFSTLPSIAKVFGEKCPAAILNPPQICSDILRQYSTNLYTMVGLNALALGTALTVNFVASKLDTSYTMIGDEAIPLSVNPRTAGNREKMGRATVILAGGVTIGQLITNLGISSVAGDAATSLGRCLVQPRNVTLVSCADLESIVYGLTTTDYVVSGVLGLFMAGTLVLSVRDSCYARRRMTTTYV